MSTNCKIRLARPQDAEELLEIFRPYVLETAVAFNYEPPTLEEFRNTIDDRLRRYPYLVAETEDGLMGYAYASPFKARAAYDWAVETSIYVSMDRKRHGIGRRLYEELEVRLKKQNILNLYACIAYPETEDAYLTRDSVAFHHELGYELIGQFHRCGYKFGRWYDMVWMEKFIGEHTVPAPEFRPFLKTEYTT